MRASHFHIATTRETPNDAEIVSHQLMLRAGLVRRVGSGLYNWLPIGLRTLRKVEAIVREEMNRAGAMELLLPVIQPGELWQESDRWDKYGLLLLKGKDRHDRDFCVGPTHEEVITDLMRHEIRSYRQLPINAYQIQIKFRDEIRPRFGVMRAREFIMKDAYSFDIDEAGMQASFDRMHLAYCAIFDRLGLEYRAVEADSGEIGGSRSREFHVLADSGEDAIAYATQGSYAANVEKAEVVSSAERPAATASLVTVDTPGVQTIDELCISLGVSADQCAKTLLVRGTEVPVVALVVRGDHQLNEIKAANLPEVADPLVFADAETIRSVVGCDAGSIGPAGLGIPVFADADAAAMGDFVAGANENDKHVTGVNWGRDLPEPLVRDLRDAQAGDQAPDGQGVYQIVRGIEVGHIFQLGTTYSEKLQATVLDEEGRPQPLQMGCYGIGVTRVVAAAIEQGNDDKGIIWPDSIAPFKVVISPIHMQKSDAVREAAESLYQTLLAAGIDVLFDDRPLRPGVMFADMELLGIPHRLVISDKLLADGKVEYKGRRDTEARLMVMDEILPLLQQ